MPLSLPSVIRRIVPLLTLTVPVLVKAAPVKIWFDCERKFLLKTPALLKLLLVAVVKVPIAVPALEVSLMTPPARLLSTVGVTPAPSSRIGTAGPAARLMVPVLFQVLSSRRTWLPMLVVPLVLRTPEPLIVLPLQSSWPLKVSAELELSVPPSSTQAGAPAAAWV